MAQQWPTTAPTVSPGTHDPVATQAYMAGGGDYFRSGYYSHGLWVSSGTSTASMGTNGAMRARPFIVPVTRAFDRIGVNVTAAAAAGGLLRLGIYTHSSGPLSLLVDAGTIAADTTGAKEAIISQTLEPGVYWLAIVSQVAVCTVTAYPTGFATPLHSELTSPPTSVNSSLAVSTNSATTTGALPSTFPAFSATGSTPAVALRAA